MSNKLEELENLHNPDEQIARQAVDSLRGYVYQIYQSLAEWIKLKENEVLLLEVAEDFAVLAKDVLTATQVKDTARSGSVTLKTRSVSNTIKSMWEFQNANPNRNVYITYLTTSKIGKERGLTFPGSHKGLTYWRIAAREGTDIEPIRQVLLGLDLPPQVKDFIKEATPDELRERILRRINWVCGEKDIEALDQVISDHLVYFGEQKGFTPTDSEKARDSLIVAILKKIVQESDRQFSRADFLRIFEKAVSISLPASAVRELIRAIPVSGKGFSGELTSVATATISIAQVPLVSRVIDRVELNAQLISVMGQSGSLWLHGSSGTGKTVLSQFIAHQSKYDWLHVQLRDCSSASMLDYHLCRVLQALQSSRIGGVILDDFPTKYAHSVRLRLSMLVNEVHRMDGSVIVTSAKTPSPNVKDCFGEDGPNVVKVPYLSRDEVAELVKLADGDAQKWAKIIHSFCWAGHPQLVQARISGLRQKNWPDAELLAGIPGIGISAKEIEDTRDSIRERLLSELLPNTRELLYRLTLLVGYFDRELAIAVGEVDPSIERPGEELDVLLGPWVEILANDCFRVSPLVSGAGMQTLSKPIQMEIHKRIVDNLIARRPFPADFLGMLLGHAIGSRHVQGLMWLTMAIIHTRDEDRRIISEHLFMLPLLDTKQPLLKENIHVSAMLRLAQFRVAAWANRVDQLPAIADKLIEESRMVDDKAIADGFLCDAISSILVERSLGIRPQKWMPLLEKFDETLLNGKGELIEYTRTLKIFKYGLEKLTVSQFLFMIRATSLRGIDEIIEFFTELDRLEAKRRKQLLLALHKYPNDIRLMIDSAWLFDTKRDDFNGVVAANKLRQAGEIAEIWGNTAIVVECECARAVMLDEYANDCDSSLASLDEAEEKYPNQVRLARQRASVYYRKGDHQAALATITQIADIIPKDHHIERAFALREAGISAAKTGDFAKASHFFSEACEAASNATDNMWPMAVGLKGDSAFVEFKLGHHVEALKLTYQSLIDADRLDPEAGPEEKYCLVALGNLILWMRSEVQGTRDSYDTICFRAGMCSNPQPLDDIMKLKSSPRLRLLAWYQLAELEVELRADIGVLEELQKRTTTTKIVLCEQSLIMQLLTGCIRTVDIEQFFLNFHSYIARTVYYTKNADKIRDKDSCDMTVSEFPVIKAGDWKKDPFLTIAKDAIVALAAVAVCSHATNFYETLQNHVKRIQHASTALEPFMECFKKQLFHKGDVYEVAASCLGRLMEKEVFVIPDDMFIITVRLWEWLFQTNFKNTVENMLADYFVESWRNIMTNQRFNLQLPMMTVPDIEAALKEPTNGIAKIAAIVVAAENAVKHKLDVTLREKLKKNKK